MNPARASRPRRDPIPTPRTEHNTVALSASPRLTGAPPPKHSLAGAPPSLLPPAHRASSSPAEQSTGSSSSTAAASFPPGLLRAGPATARASGGGARCPGQVGGVGRLGPRAAGWPGDGSGEQRRGPSLPMWRRALSLTRRSDLRSQPRRMEASLGLEPIALDAPPSPSRTRRGRGGGSSCRQRQGERVAQIWG